MPSMRRADSWDLELRNLALKGSEGTYTAITTTSAIAGPSSNSRRPSRIPGFGLGLLATTGTAEARETLSNGEVPVSTYRDASRYRGWRGFVDSFRRHPDNNTASNAGSYRHTMYGWPRERLNEGGGGGGGVGGGGGISAATPFAPYTDDDNGGGGRGGVSRNSISGYTGLPPMITGGHYYDLHMANVQTAQTALARRLKGRHLQMIAIGGSIGTGLFVASGSALATGGPGSLIVSFSLVGIMLYCTVQALGEMAVVFPVAGSFSAYSTRFLDPSWGFAMGWNYAMQWLVVLPLEVIAASLTIGYWNQSVSRSIFVTIFLLIIVFINFFGVEGYGEAEFVFAIIKAILTCDPTIIYSLLGIIVNIGGPPNDGYIGTAYWHEPGAFNNGFKGLCSVFVTAAFAFAGTELVGLAAAETANPRKSLPTAIKQVFWRITVFYILSLFLIGLLVPHTEPRLQAANNKADARASPFVIAIESAGISVLPSIMNVVILIAVLSVGNSAVFGSSRTLAALADQRQAPKIFGYVDRKGRPLVAIVVASMMGLIAYLADFDVQDKVLDWLLAISGLSTIFTWGSICLAHIRFRRAWVLRNRSLHDLAFRAQAGVLGSWLGLAFNCLVLVAQFWTGLAPVGHTTMTGRKIAERFFLAYLAAPIVLIFYGAHKFYYRTKFIRTRDMDLDTGRRDFNLAVMMAQEQEEKQSWPRWKKIYNTMC